jgi:hypothetical protein
VGIDYREWSEKGVSTYSIPFQRIQLEDFAKDSLKIYTFSEACQAPSSIKHVYIYILYNYNLN